MNRRRTSARARLTATGAALRERARAVMASVEGASEEPEPDLVAPPRLMPARVGAGVAALVCVTLVVAVAMGFGPYSTRTQRFVVSDFDVQGNLRVSDAEVIAASGVALGTPTLAVAPPAVRARVEALPWVAHADVHTVMPSRLVVRVREHEPVALVADRDLLLVNREGLLFKTVDPGADLDLPIITGVPVHALRGGAEREPGEAAVQRVLLRRALDMLARVARSPLAERLVLSEVHWDPVQGLSLVSAPDGAEWRVGHREGEELQRVLDRMARLQDHMRARGKRLRYALMDDPRRPERAVIHAVDADSPVLLALEGRSQKAGGAANARLPHAGKPQVRSDGVAGERRKGGRARDPASASADDTGTASAEEEPQSPEEPVLGD